MPIRPFAKEDRPVLHRMIEATEVFKPEEVEVALELMDVEINDEEQDDYALFTYVDEGGKVRGYYCVGATPMTDATFDLYWIVVDPTTHAKGIGSELLRHCEQFVRDEGGKLIVVETSSKPSYGPTRKFYAKHRYEQAGRIKDYYADGDDLVVFTKHLS